MKETRVGKKETEKERERRKLLWRLLKKLFVKKLCDNSLKRGEVRGGCQPVKMTSRRS